MNDINTMTVRERLEKTDRDDRAIRYEAGRAAGVAFTSTTATLAEARTIAFDTFSHSWLNGPGAFISRIESVVEYCDALEEGLEGTLASTAWVQGFVEGCTSVLNEVGLQ